MSIIERTDDRDAVLGFIVSQQGDPGSACAYLGGPCDGIADDLEGLDQPWLETLRVVRSTDGAITGAACIEWDEESDIGWVYGPWCSAATWDGDAGALLSAVCPQTGVSVCEMYAPLANTRLAQLAVQLGWRAGAANYVYETSRAGIAKADAHVREASTDDLPALRALHEAEFPGTYATARQLVEDHTALVLVEDGEFLGYVAGHPDGENLYLDYVATTLAARRRGVGTRLIGALAASLTGRQVTLTVDEKAAAAIAMYDAAGWSRVAATRAYRSA